MNQRTKKYDESLPSFKSFDKANPLHSFSQPYGICFKGEFMYITDMDTSSLYIMKKTFSSGCKFVKKVTCTPFNHPRGVAVTDDGDILVVDSGNNQIKVLDSTGEILKMVIGKPGSGVGEFNNPRGICVLPHNQFVVCDTDNCRLHVFNSDTGEHLQTFGEPGDRLGQYKYPLSVACDKNRDRLAVTDCDNHRIQCYQIIDRRVDFYIDDESTTTLGPWSNPVPNFKLPAGVVYDHEGNLLVSELGNNQIQVFDEKQRFLTKIGKLGESLGEFSAPRSLAIDDDGRIYVADSRNRRIQSFQSC